MNKHIQKIEKAWRRGVHLDVSEKNAIRTELATHIAQHPVRKKNLVRQIDQTQKATSYILIKHKPMFATIAAIVLLALGGGTSYAAENALPGEALYPVKVGINEEVRAAFAFDDEKKAEWQAERAERRLEEAEKLIEEGTLTVDIEKKLSERLEKHISKTQEKLSKLEEKGNNDAVERLSNRLETALRLHGAIVAQNDDGTSDSQNGDDEFDATDDESTAPGRDANPKHTLLKNIIKNHDKVSDLRERVQKKLQNVSDEDLKTAALARIQSTEPFISKVREEAADVADTLTDEQNARIEAQISASENHLSNARASYDEGTYAEAIQYMAQAHGVAVQAHVLIRTKLRAELKTDEDGQVVPRIDALKIRLNNLIENRIDEGVNMRLRVEQNDDAVTSKVQGTPLDRFDATDDEFDATDDEFDATDDEFEIESEVEIPDSVRLRLQQGLAQ